MVVTKGEAWRQVSSPALGSGCWCLELPRASEAVSAQAPGSARLRFEFDCPISCLVTLNEGLSPPRFPHLSGVGLLMASS